MLSWQLNLHKFVIFLLRFRAVAFKIHFVIVTMETISEPSRYFSKSIRRGHGECRECEEKRRNTWNDVSSQQKTKIQITVTSENCSRYFFFLFQILQ